MHVSVPVVISTAVLVASVSMSAPADDSVGRTAARDAPSVNQAPLNCEGDRPVGGVTSYLAIRERSAPTSYAALRSYVGISADPATFRPRLKSLHHQIYESSADPSNRTLIYFTRGPLGWLPVLEMGCAPRDRA